MPIAVSKPSYSITSSIFMMAGAQKARPHIRQLEGALLQRTAGPYIGSPNLILTMELSHRRNSSTRVAHARVQQV